MSHPGRWSRPSTRAGSTWRSSLRCRDQPLEVLRRENPVWVAAPDHAAWEEDPLPLALFEDCAARRNLLEGLSHAGRSYRCAYSSESTLGLIAAVQSGLAVAGLARCSVPPALRIIGEPQGLPDAAPGPGTGPAGRFNGKHAGRQAAGAIPAAGTGAVTAIPTSSHRSPFAPPALTPPACGWPAPAPLACPRILYICAATSRNRSSIPRPQVMAVNPDLLDMWEFGYQDWWVASASSCCSSAPRW